MVLLFRERCVRAGEARGMSGVLVCAVRGWIDVIWNALADRFERGPSPETTDKLGDAMIRILLQELRIAVRTYLRQPFFTIMVLVTLAVGIGATTAIFSLVNSAVLRPLPYPRSDEIVSIVQNSERFGLIPFSGAYLRDFRDRMQQVEALAGFSSSWSLTLTGSGEPRMVTAAYVSDGLLELLGARIAAGRDISPEEHASQTARVAIVSRGFWQREFGAAASFDEKIIRLNDVPHVIVGVLQEDLLMPITSSLANSSRTSAEMWLPLSTNELVDIRNIPIMNVVGRLRKGVILAQAQSELNAAVASIGRDYPQLTEGGEVRIMPLRDLVSRDVRRPLFLLLGAVSGLLLIGCANVGNLLLARSARRTEELAVRVSLGATRWRIAGQMLLESLVLTSAGAASGLGLAWWSLRIFPALGFEQLPPSATTGIDARVAVFAVACAIGTALLIGLIPALQASDASPHALLKQGGRTTVGRGRRVRQSLVFTEVSVALVLLILAGLLGRSFWRLTRVDSGISADQVLAGGVSLPAARYPGGPIRRAFVDAALNQLAAVRGVERVALVNRLPFGGSNVLVGVEVEGSSAATGETPTMDRRVVSAGYFETMGIPVIAGRTFGNEDREDAVNPVAIVNATAARLYWPDGSPVGRQLRLMLRTGPGPWLQIVGIVGDVRHHGLDQAAQPEIYVPYAQASVESFVLLMRSSGDPLALAPALRETVQRLDPDLPLQHTAIASEGIAQSIAEPRVRTLIFNAFGIVALLLAALGIYAVISYSVASRTRDIGLRLAFGATRSDIFRMVLREGMGLVAAASCTGIIGALSLARVIQTQLFEISPTDPATFIAITGVLLLVAFLAHVFPAVRAVRLDPVTALRTE
jgi:putative ABC transport system permease protein